MLHLILKELFYRKTSTLLSFISIALAVTCLVSALSLLEGHKVLTDDIFQKAKTKQIEIMTKAEDKYRISTKDLGFNVLILPKAQNLSNFYADDFASKYMPEKFVETLANNRIVTVRHLLPSLKQKINWTEMKQTIILVGTRGEVPVIHKNPKKPLQQPVEDGHIVLGFQLAKDLNLKKDQTVTLLGEEFNISLIHSPRGNKDDITAWIPLAASQKILNKPKLINAILALECKCAWADIEKVKKELEKILPETQIIGMERRKAKTRKEIRTTAELLTKNSIKDILENRKNQELALQSFANILIPLVMLTCCIWIGFLAMTNVRDRKYEIGLLKALGLLSEDIILLFVGKAFLLGFIGSVFGFVIGAFGTSFFGGITIDSDINNVVFSGKTIFLIIFLTPFLSILASWIPAIYAAKEDPAEILRGE